MSDAVFHPYDPHKPVRMYRRDLPHWRQDGATYFVTFRQADSIPHFVLSQWKQERNDWYAAHGLHTGLDESEFNRIYAAIPERERRQFERVQARRLFTELDRGHGSCLLRHASNRSLIAEALHFMDGARCHVGDWVIMPNHVHLLLQPWVDQSLECILQSVKRWTSTRMHHKPAGGGRFWQPDSYDHIVRDRPELRRIRRYIRDNPAKAGVGDAFSYSTAEWLDRET